jgi:hypothetical protein
MIDHIMAETVSWRRDDNDGDRVGTLLKSGVGMVMCCSVCMYEHTTNTSF